MTSGRRGAPGRLGALYGKLPARQIGIGYYESTGQAPEVSPVTSTASQAPQIVSAPEPASNVASLTAEQKGAYAALTVMGMFGAAVLAAWAGYSLTDSLRRGSA